MPIDGTYPVEGWFPVSMQSIETWPPDPSHPGIDSALQLLSANPTSGWAIGQLPPGNADRWSGRDCLVLYASCGADGDMLIAALHKHYVPSLGRHVLAWWYGTGEDDHLGHVCEDALAICGS